MSGRLYGMLYPTPSPSAEIERIWRKPHDVPRSPASSGICKQAEAGSARPAKASASAAVFSFTAPVCST